MRRKHFAIALGLCLIAAVSANAAPIASDNFNDGVAGPMWTPIAATETGGVVQIVNDGKYDSAPNGYTLSGDFDVSIDVKNTSWTGPSTTTYGTIHSLYVYADASNRIAVHFRSEGTSQGTVWYGRGLIAAGGGLTFGATQAFLNPDQGVQLRAVHAGTTLTGYIRQQGATSWTELYSVSGTTANTYTVAFSTNNYNGAAATSQFDNFVVPEPATLGLLATGGVAAFVRRRSR